MFVGRVVVTLDEALRMRMGRARVWGSATWIVPVVTSFPIHHDIFEPGSNSKLLETDR